MVQQKWYNGIFQCQSFPSAGIASDHELVLRNLETELPRYRPKKTRIKREQWNLSKLKEDSQPAMFAQSHRTVGRRTTDDERRHTYWSHMFNSEDRGNGITTISEDAKKPWITQDTFSYWRS